MEVIDLMPKSTPEYMAPAWVGCVLWAAGDAGILRQFAAETGLGLAVKRSPLDAMIDVATGRDEAVVRAFVEWVNVNLWGDPFAEPAAIAE